MIEFKGELAESTLKFYKKRMVRSRQGTNIFFLVFGLPMLTFFSAFCDAVKIHIFYSCSCSGNCRCFFTVSYD